MNILPIVFTFLVIFSFLTADFILDHHQSQLAEYSFNTFRKVERILHNTMVKKNYQRIPTATAVKPSTDAPTIIVTATTTSRSYRSKRDHYPPADRSKLNLSALLETKTDPRSHPLYEITANFLSVLYSKHFTNEAIVYELLDAMLRTASAKKEITKLADLYPDLPQLQALYYTLLKGTSHYDINRGIAPLDDFFCVQKGTGIHFSYASPPLLEALFGKDGVQKIMEEEKKRWDDTGTYTYLTKDDLTALFAHDHNFNSSITALGTHLNFSKQSGKIKVICAQDRKTGLIIQEHLD